MIRRATDSDIPALLAMGEQFAPYVGWGTYSPERSEAMIRALLTSGAVFVSETDGRIDGAILGTMTPIWYAQEDAAAELALWVVPDSRGGRVARELVAAFEGWAKERGAQFITMSDLRIGDEYPAGALFERLGYRVIERSHTKEVR